MVHVGQVLVPSSMKEMLSFVDQIEILLNVQEIFKKSCIISEYTSAKAMYKRDTLDTPIFNRIVIKTRDCH